MDMPLTSWSGLFVWWFSTPERIVGFLAAINWYAMGIAFLAPTLMLIVRYEVRLARLRSILDFMKNFDLPELRHTTPSTAPSAARITVKQSEGKDGGVADITPITANELRSSDNAEEFTAPADGSGGGGGSRTNPSFEYVKSKYIADLKVVSGGADYKRLNEARTDSERLDIYIEIASRPFRNISGRLYLTSFGFMLVSYFGFRTLFLAFGYGAADQCDPAGGCGMSLSQAIGAFAFAGAYVVGVRMLIRRLAVFDLSAFSFLWQSAELIATVLIVVLIYNAVPDPVGGVEKVGKPLVEATTRAIAGETRLTEPTTTGSITADATTASPPTGAASADKATAPVTRIPLVWLALAPALGLLPQSASQFLLAKVRNKIPWWKTVDNRFDDVTQVVALDIIDGIDFETRFRLEESGIYDVQNLATYNPIMLFIETPYGIYQCIDWVAQAQLCHILGPEKFLLFREMNIRTIFDLERAIDSIYSPDAYDAICAAILFSPTASIDKVVVDTNFKFAVLKQDRTTELTDSETYFKWVHEMLAADGTSRSIEHLAAWISDDLHVRRLRRLWNDIAASLGPDSEYLDDSKRNPKNWEKMKEIAAMRQTEKA
jgi:hypothetical protein